MTRIAIAIALALALAALLAAPAQARERERDDGARAAVAGALLATHDRTPDAPLPDTTPDENDAGNACAQAAEEQMWNDGREARVERFNAVTARENGGYKVKGAIRVADAGDGYRMRFSCVVNGLDVRSVMVSI